MKQCKLPVRTYIVDVTNEGIDSVIDSETFNCDIYSGLLEDSMDPWNVPDWVSSLGNLLQL